MSSTTRTTVRGGKGTKGDTISKTQKPDKTDTSKAEKNKSGKGSGDKNQSQNSDSRNSKHKDLRLEDPNIKDKVRVVTELTGRSEDDACFALHECSDINQAVNMLIESSDQDWVTSVKKKKNRQASTNKTENTENATDDWEIPAPAPGERTEREKSRSRGGGPPRMRGRGSWRGRESRENEKNLEDSKSSETNSLGGERGMGRRGRMSNGPLRGGGAGRGGRGGGRMGARTFSQRDRPPGPRTMETWGTQPDIQPTENWDNDFPSPIDDWYNEEYTGSLADSKVFTPSSHPEALEKERSPGAPPPAVIAESDAGGGLPKATSDLPALSPPQQLPGPVVGGGAPAGLGVGSLTASQSQFLSSLAAQNEDAKPGQQGFPSQPYGAPQPYTPPDHQPPQPQPQRTKTQRARVPPPSKIPASAVEMPGELNSSVGYLDVEFGALDLISDSSSFDGVSESKFVTSSSGGGLESSPGVPTGQSLTELGPASQPQPTIDTFTASPPKPAQTQSSISSALTQSQMLSSNDSIPAVQPTSDHMSSVSGSYGSNRSVSGTGVSGGNLPVSSTVSLEAIGKDSYSQPQPSSYAAYGQSKSAYQSQTGYGAAANTYSQASSGSYVNSSSNSSGYGTGVQQSNSYQNSGYGGSGGAAAYQSATASAFPSISQSAASYQPAAPSHTSYQQTSNANQSVYGTTTGLNNSSNYVSGSAQYNSYSASSANSHNHKMSASDKQYDSSTTVASNVTSTTSVSSTSALGLTNSQTSSNSAGTKVTNSAAKSGVVTNIPPVAPMMGTQYIMGQAGMPFYQQPAMYSYEDLQLLQQRVPPHMGYYDMGYQTTPTTLGNREGSMASGAYSMSDSRFTRADSNASPVPSTLSQQTSTQSHQAQPMLSATLPPGYAYFYNATGMMPGSFQYGAPIGAPTAIYSQMPGATNAHGSTNLSQYPKPSNYGSSYGSGYETLSQSQEYAKSGYVGSQAAAKPAVTTGSSANSDLSAMYGKTHAALGKVNSYEKQGFHSGTPPPFGLAGSGGGGAGGGMAPGGTYAPQMYIPTMPHHQQHSTTLMHQPLHQMDIRQSARRMDSGNSSSQRSASSGQNKASAKQSYPTSYWNNA